MKGKGGRGRGGKNEAAGRRQGKEGVAGAAGCLRSTRTPPPQQWQQTIAAAAPHTGDLARAAVLDDRVVVSSTSLTYGFLLLRRRCCCCCYWGKLAQNSRPSAPLSHSTVRCKPSSRGTAGAHPSPSRAAPTSANVPPTSPGRPGNRCTTACDAVPRSRQDPSAEGGRTANTCRSPVLLLLYSAPWPPPRPRRPR